MLNPSSKECSVAVNVGTAVVVPDVLSDQNIACHELKGNGDCFEGERVQAKGNEFFLH